MDNLATGLHRLLELGFDDVIRLGKMPDTLRDGGIKSRSIARTLNRLLLSGILLSLSLRLHEPCGNARRRCTFLDRFLHRRISGLNLITCIKLFGLINDSGRLLGNEAFLCTGRHDLV